MRPLLVGVDFDNTIVSYDELFYRVALEQGVISSDTERSKDAVRDRLRRVGREDDWTELQGYVYGVRMAESLPFPDVLACLGDWQVRGLAVCIVSHKTRHPYRGPAYDLHQAAWQWLENQGLFDPTGVGLSREAVFFELTKQEKLDRIACLGCTHFIDDLPEILADLGALSGLQRILFDPHGQAPDADGIRRVVSWSQMDAALGLQRPDEKGDRHRVYEVL